MREIRKEDRLEVLCPGLVRLVHLCSFHRMPSGIFGISDSAHELGSVGLDPTIGHFGG